MHARPNVRPPDTEHAADRFGDGGQRETITLSAESLRAPTTARRYIDGHLRTWAVPRHLRAEAALLVSELVTNAVRHSGSERFTLIVAIAGGRVVVTVLDGGRYKPLALKISGPEEEGGRGLTLVAALADDWGHYEHRGQLAVYAALRLDAPQESAC